MQANRPLIPILILVILAALVVTPDSALAEPLGQVERTESLDHGVTLHFGGPAMRVQFWSDSIVRLHLSPDGRFDYYNDYNQYMIEPGLRSLAGPGTLHAEEDEEGMTLESGAIRLRIRYSPFRLFFHDRESGRLMTANPPDKSFDTDVKAWFERDAGGVTEHFAGLHFRENITTLDRRGETVWMEDRNGFGWAAPLYMSTAGYGIFLHNEYGWETRFDFTDPIMIDGTGANGRMDLFYIHGPSWPGIIERYTALTGRTPMPARKRLGFKYLVQGTPIDHEEAFPEWVERGYPIDSCITFTDKPVATAEEVAAVARTARAIHSLDGLFGFYFDLKPAPGTFRDLTPSPMEYPHRDWEPFKRLLTERLLEQGVDWFWVDETDDYGKIDINDERFPFHLYRAMTEAMEAMDSRRPFTCGRGGYAGCQRFGYPWMGDTEYDKQAVLAMLNNGLIGVSWSTLDMASALLSNKSEAHYLAGVKLNLLAPITQCNAWVPGQNPSHRPWEWSRRAELVFKKFLNLRYRLVPYLYTTGWQAHRTGMPVWRPLIFEQPGDPGLFERDEVLIGDWLLMAPLYEEPAREVRLPPGEWMYYFDNERVFQGPMTIEAFEPPIEEYPLFVRRGAIIPMMPAMDRVDGKPVDPLTLDIYPADASSFTLYEDDGETRDYLAGESCTTHIECERSAEGIEIRLGARSGRFDPGRRSLLLKVHADWHPSEVLLHGKALLEQPDLGALEWVEKGWARDYDAETRSSRVLVKFPDRGLATRVALVR